jgi:hypothetical protein
LPVSSWSAPGGWRVVEVPVVRKGKDVLRYTVILSGVVVAECVSVAEVPAWYRSSTYARSLDWAGLCQPTADGALCAPGGVTADGEARRGHYPPPLHVNSTGAA